MKKLILVSVITLNAGAFAAPTLTNGSMNTSAPREKWYGPLAPDAWTAGGSGYGGSDMSPDISNINGALGFYDFIANASDSPDGGAWAGFANGAGFPDFTEQISQSVSGFDIGKKYRITWFFANFGLASAGYPMANEASGVAVSVDGTKIGQGSLRTVQSGWATESVDFTATSTTHSIALGSLANPGKENMELLSYVFVDNVKLGEVIPPTAVPTLAGVAAVGSHVIGAYNYAGTDSEDITAMGTHYKFVTSPNTVIVSSASGDIVAQGASGGMGATSSYTVKTSDIGQHLFYCVTPVSTSATVGAEICTAAVGPVADAPKPPSDVVPRPVPSLSLLSVTGLGGLMFALFAWVGRRRAFAN